MLEITEDYRNRVAEALLEARNNYDGSDGNYAQKHGINSAVFNRIKKGERDKVLSCAKWLSIGRNLDVVPGERKWNMARTDVFNQIEEEVIFCKQYAKSRIFVDDCAIGKTYSAQHLSRTLKNCFYLDASQCKTKILFARALAKCIGVESFGTYAEVKENVKYYLKTIPQPIVIIDEAGDVDYKTFSDIKEYWNATNGVCGWYMMGADGLRKKIREGIKHETQSYKEVFSRFSDRFSFAVPRDKRERVSFYRKLITDVLSVNVTDKSQLSSIVNRCLQTDSMEGDATGLRRAESLLILSRQL